MFGFNWYILVIVVTAILTYLFMTGVLKEKLANGALVQLTAIGPQDWYLN